MQSLIGLLSPLFCFLLHLLIYRLVAPAHRMPRQKLTVLVVAVVALGAWILAGVHAAVLSLLFGYVYFHWFNMSETARRIRILVSYVAGITHSEPYAPNAIFKHRIERLIENGTVTKEGDELILHRGPLVWATRVIFFWRKLFYP